MLAASCCSNESLALTVPPSLTSNGRNAATAGSAARVMSELMVSPATEEVTGQSITLEAPPESDLTSAVIPETAHKEQTNSMPDLAASLQKKMGTVDEDRLIYPELKTGEVTRLFSSLKYVESDDGTVKASHSEGSVVGAAALVAGTTIGAGVLALPTSTAAAGFLPSTAGMGIAWFYMTMSGLLIAELTLNRIGTSGRPGLGLLELYENSLGKNLGRVGSAAYFFLHYAIMVASVAQGGTNLDGFLESVGLSDIAAIPGVGEALFAGTAGAVMYFANAATIEKINKVLVFGVVASFLGIVGVGSTTADFGALIDPAAQHPEEVVNCFPILFLAMVFQNVVPGIVTQLEGNRIKITNAIIAGTSIPFLMILAFNGVVLGNALGAGVDLTSGVNPVDLLQSNVVGSPLLGNLVGGFSMLAVTTSLIGFTHGLLDAWTDVFGLQPEGKEFDKWKSGLFGLVFVPPLALSVANPDIFYDALDYAGAFGVSTLFLVLPPYMVWRERYGDDKPPLATKPLVPFGKIPLASMYKAAGTLILEQGAEKLGIFEFIANHLPSLPSLAS